MINNHSVGYIRSTSIFVDHKIAKLGQVNLLMDHIVKISVFAVYSLNTKLHCNEYFESSAEIHNAPFKPYFN